MSRAVRADVQPRAGTLQFDGDLSGAINGTTSILQTGCANTVTYSCGTCP